MRLRDVFRDPPALDGTVGERNGRADQLAFVDAALDDVRQKVDPALGGQIRLALLDHRRDGRNRVADDDLGVAAVAFGQDELVERGENLGALPVHAGDGHVAAFGACRTRHGQEAGDEAGGSKKMFHIRSLICGGVVMPSSPAAPPPQGS